MKKIVRLFTLASFFYISQFNAQTGISVSPPRVYFESEVGASKTEKITVTNVSTNNALDLAVSLGDWEYDEKGENVMYPANTLDNSCASWISVNKNDSYFTLLPGEKKEIEVTLTPTRSKNDKTAHTSVLYVSQMNPVDDVDSKGANIKLSIRSGIKIFHKNPISKGKKIEIKNLEFNKTKKSLVLVFENQSEIWVDGKILTDIINTKTGHKITIDPIIFYTMPGNKRILEIPAESLEKGSYTASVIIDNGENDSVEMGELNFNYD